MMNDNSYCQKLIEEAGSAANVLSTHLKYRVGPLESTCEADGRLYLRLRHAHALLSMITGQGAIAFSNLNDAIRDDYLCCVKDLVSAMEVDAQIIGNRRSSS